MTRGERLLSGTVATRMDGVESCYSAKTADSLGCGRDDDLVVPAKSFNQKY
jgi:hypothetical protein